MSELIHYSHCPVCGSPSIEKVLSVKDYTVSGQQFDIFHCSYCTARFTQDVPSLQAIGAFYKSDDYISHTNTSKGLINKLYQQVRRRTMEQKATMVEKFTGEKNGRLLDLGCGVGTFLHTMHQKGWKVEGLEPDEGARELAKTTYGLDIKPSHHLFDLPHHHFEAITMWHVLEHVHQLHDYVKQLKLLLAGKGKIFIAVPNYTSRDAKAYKRFWAAYDVPRHLYHFSPQSMHILMQSHGLKVVKMLPMWYDSFYVSLLSSRYKNGGANYAGAGLHGLASNLNAAGNTKACSSIIYIVEAGS